MIKNKQTEFQFITLMAALMSMVALSIDAILPALHKISIDIGFTNSNDAQLLITSIFLGLGFGQLIFGPLSDSIGRKPSIYIGFVIFVIASFICVSANSLETIIFGRVLQGIGLSAPRTISIAMVRDSFSGDYMAKIMSFITVIFILIPVIAPAIGKILLENFGWKFIFESQLVYGILIITWLYFRQAETLHAEHRKKININLFIEGTKEFLKHRQAIIFTCISGFITGSFMVYLSTSEQIFRMQYHLTEQFPYIFAGLAIAIGFATFLNGKFVMRIGMLNMVKIFLTLFTLISLIYVIFFHNKENPSLTTLVIFFTLQFFSIGFLFGNLRSLAMQPIGHIAGIGAAINGFVSTIMAVPIATFIGKQITTTTLPIFFGFFIGGSISLILLSLIKKSPKKGFSNKN